LIGFQQSWMARDCPLVSGIEQIEQVGSPCIGQAGEVHRGLPGKDGISTMIVLNFRSCRLTSAGIFRILSM
jgi:hypothetical protein